MDQGAGAFYAGQDDKAKIRVNEKKLSKKAKLKERQFAAAAAAFNHKRKIQKAVSDDIDRFATKQLAVSVAPMAPPAAVEAPAPVVVAPVVTAPAVAAVEAPAPASTVAATFAFRVWATEDGAERSFIVFGADIVDAVQRASRALSARSGAWHVVAIKKTGTEALV